MDSKDLFVGLDLGGTEIKAGLGEGDAELTWERVVPSRVEEGRDAVLEALADVGAEALAAAAERSRPVVGVGLGSPGIIDHRTGRVLFAPANLPEWKDLELGSFLEERLGRPIHLDNDANSATFAEASFGAGRGHENVVMVTVGTGIGGGATVDGRLVHGARGAGMELGHVPLVPHGGRPCSCGKDGCVEAYAGGWGMRREWIAALEARDLVEWNGRPAAESTLRDLIGAAVVGDPDAAKIMAEGADALGTALVAALHLLDSRALILGGGIVEGYADYVPMVEARIRDRALEKVLDGLVIAKAQFGNRAGVLGAVALARDAFGGNHAGG